MNELQAGSNSGNDSKLGSPGPRPAPSRGSAAPGLVNGAISRQKHAHSHIRGTITVNKNGIKAKRNNIKPPYGITHNASRKEIKGFSNASRRRMQDYLTSIDWEPLKAISKTSRDSRGVFVTLTYPEAYSVDWTSWKRHLDNFRKHLIRGYGADTAVIWKLENQESRCLKTGAEFIPHFHLAIDFKERIDIRSFRIWLSHIWYLVVGSNDPKHLAAGTNARPIYGETGKLLSYLGKYLSKTFEAKVKTGRVWGVWNKLILAPVNVYPDEPWVDFLRRVRAYGKYSKYLSHLNIIKTQGLRMYGEDLEQLVGRNYDDQEL